MHVTTGIYIAKYICQSIAALLQKWPLKRNIANHLPMIDVSYRNPQCEWLGWGAGRNGATVWSAPWARVRKWPMNGSHEVNSTANTNPLQNSERLWGKTAWVMQMWTVKADAAHSPGGERTSRSALLQRRRRAPHARTDTNHTDHQRQNTGTRSRFSLTGARAHNALHSRLSAFGHLPLDCLPSCGAEPSCSLSTSGERDKKKTLYWKKNNK